MALLILVGLLTLGFLAWRRTFVTIELAGFADGAVAPPAEIAGRRVGLAIDPPSASDRAVVTFDGDRVDDLEVTATGVALLLPDELDDGRYTVAVEVSRPLLSSTTGEWSFTVDGTAPTIDLPPAVEPVAIDQPVEIVGSVDTDAALWANGTEVDVEPDGSFVLRYGFPPAAPITLRAEDGAGNAVEAELVVPVSYPGAQGFHVTAAAWGDERLRAEVLALVDSGEVTAVELDLKDEAGVVGYDSDVALAREIGAVRAEYVLEEAVEILHDRGVRVIGRIVAFNDKVLADAAWARGDRDWVIRSADGGRFDKYDGGFTNYVRPEVRQYNIDLAVEAAERGVDEILWDYVRRPEGHPDTMVVPGLQGVSSDVVTGFLADAHAALRPLGVYQGASVFGIAASRPDSIAQNVPDIARNTDYVAPMLYPSHWTAGEYGVADPNAQPYDIIKASLEDFQEVLEGTNKPLVPWLQDFTIGGVTYGPEEVEAQVRAARELGVHDFLLWNASVSYTYPFT